jgi:hypothetical protein
MQGSDIESDRAEIGLGDAMLKAIYVTLLQTGCRIQKQREVDWNKGRS